MRSREIANKKRKDNTLVAPTTSSATDEAYRLRRTARPCQICHHTDWLLCAVGCGDLACIQRRGRGWGGARPWLKWKEASVSSEGAVVIISSSRVAAAYPSHADSYLGGVRARVRVRVRGGVRLRVRARLGSELRLGVGLHLCCL